MLDWFSSVALELCLLLLPVCVVPGEDIKPSCSKVAMNHVERSVLTLSCFSASERIFRACFSLSISASLTKICIKPFLEQEKLNKRSVHLYTLQFHSRLLRTNDFEVRETHSSVHQGRRRCICRPRPCMLQQ